MQKITVKEWAALRNITCSLASWYVRKQRVQGQEFIQHRGQWMVDIDAPLPDKKKRGPKTGNAIKQENC